MSKCACTDHLGNIFSSIEEKCNFYKISRYLYTNRIRRGWSEEKALTTPVVKNITDHLGNIFSSVEEKCNFYRIPRYLYDSRISKGMSEEKALTLALKNTSCTDHLGNTFSSTEEKCNFYRIPRHLYDSRIKSGMSEEEALTLPLQNKRSCTDHLGNIFSSTEEKCNFYRIPRHLYINRIRRGWSEEKALTYNIDKYKKNESIQDPITQIFISKDSLCLIYKIDIKKYNDRKYKGFSLPQILEISPRFHSHHIKIDKTVYNLRIDKRIKKCKDVFECYKINEDGTETFRIMSQEMIDQYCIEQYKKEKGLM